MATVKYTQVLDDQGFRGFRVYLQHLYKKPGVVEDLLLDEETGLSQYLVVRVGGWPWSHFLLLPFAQVSVDYEQQCFYLRWPQDKNIHKVRVNSLATRLRTQEHQPDT